MNKWRRVYRWKGEIAQAQKQTDLKTFPSDLIQISKTLLAQPKEKGNEVWTAIDDWHTITLLITVSLKQTRHQAWVFGQSSRVWPDYTLEQQSHWSRVIFHKPNWGEPM